MVARNPEHTDTIAAIATPPGQGGVGIVKVSGPDSSRIITAICKFRPEHRKCSHTAFYDAHGQVLDRGMALFFQGPDSHTGEDIAELHGHGGPVVMNMLLQRVLSSGARYARPGEFSERAFLNNKIDLLQAEAVADLIASASEQAAMSAVRSLEGLFSSLLEGLVKHVTDLRVYVEATLDFPEEEIDPLAETELQDRLAACRRSFADICARAETGRLLAEGLKIAIIGKPNAGKSSLLNRLAQVERAIVSAQPGTTRDTIEQQILLDGIPVNVIDTAGIRKAGNSIEQEGIRRARAAAGNADVVILIADVNRDEMADLKTIAAQFSPGKNLLYVFNKIDLSGHEPGRPPSSGETREIFLSAKTGAGIDALKQEIKHCVMASDYSENTFIAHTRHISVLREAGAMLEQAAKQFQRHHAVELFADDLSRLQQTLGVITGQHTPDDLLGEIFSRFCIGK